MLEYLKSQIYFENSLLDYSISLAAIIGGFLFIWIVKTIFIRRLKKFASKTKTKLDDAVINLTQKFIVPVLYFVVLYLALSSLNLNPAFQKAIGGIVAIMVTFFGIRLILELVKFSIFAHWIIRKPERQQYEAHFRSLMPAFSVLVWGTGFVFILDNLGFNISAIVTGLGIGGVAVALAASAILGDLFAYVSIMFDKPFVLGDFLIVGDFLGSVEHIGIKTTRLRSLGGEQLIFSNKDLTDSRIRNYKRMDNRRVLFKLGVTYDTALTRMKEIPDLIKSIINKVPQTKFDRAHFSSYGDFNLVIEVVYYVLSPDYNKYMDIQEQINFAIKEEFEKHKIEFAFPTQTIYVNKT